MQFNATPRSVQGTSASRRLRRASRVPAIVYGGKEQPVNIELDHNEIFHALRKEKFHASILDMQLEGKSQQVLLRSVQWHPFKQIVMHLDFQRVSADQTLHTKVPLHFINAEVSPAVKISAAIISHVLTDQSARIHRSRSEQLGGWWFDSLGRHHVAERRDPRSPSRRHQPCVGDCNREGWRKR